MFLNLSKKIFKLLNKKSIKSGYLFMISGIILYVISDTIMKYFLNLYCVTEITFFRTLFRFIPFIFILTYKKLNPLKTERKAENIFRALLASASTLAFMAAYKYSSITEVAIIGYATAIFAIPIGYLLLHETFYIQHALAVIIGFIGVLLIFKPGAFVFESGAMFATVAAFLAALNQSIIKRLSTTESEFTIIAYHNIFLIMISFSLCFFQFKMPAFSHFIMLLLGGIFGAIAQYFIIHAYSLAPISKLAVTGYSGLIPMIILDYAVWNSVPDIFVICGLLFIIFGNYISYKFVPSKKFREL